MPLTYALSFMLQFLTDAFSTDVIMGVQIAYHFLSMSSESELDDAIGQISIAKVNLYACVLVRQEVLITIIETTGVSTHTNVDARPHCFLLTRPRTRLIYVNHK